VIVFECFERTNGNGKVTETENIFTYATEVLRMNVILAYFCNRAQRYGNGSTET